RAVDADGEIVLGEVIGHREMNWQDRDLAGREGAGDRAGGDGTVPAVRDRRSVRLLDDLAKEIHGEGARIRLRGVDFDAVARVLRLKEVRRAPRDAEGVHGLTRENNHAGAGFHDEIREAVAVDVTGHELGGNAADLSRTDGSVVRNVKIRALRQNELHAL